MAASSRAQVLDLYRAMLRESKRFSAYNYRTYAVRRIRDAFRENKNVKDPVEIQTLVNKAKRDLGVIRRQPPHREYGLQHSELTQGATWGDACLFCGMRSVPPKPQRGHQRERQPDKQTFWKVVLQDPSVTIKIFTSVYPTILLLETFYKEKIRFNKRLYIRMIILALSGNSLNVHHMGVIK
ncbi:LYR motif-containing protein 4 isoform X1 [Symphalangus syndactylus]|uniref:LYR motif-containing protein 4 isoform X1 n=1 Tax=Symphalangus syndactylus TaxID=9590 RepID=UPI003006DE7B